uniref:Puromycin-sensitive aminopeptidase n=1 Tax=Zonotrichia albicollis TaxID=44394 RepID=A0A8D2MR86_ZONAL
MVLKPWQVQFHSPFFGFLLQVKNATNQIVMNCADIDIITASYAPEGDEGGSPACFRFCPAALIHFHGLLSALSWLGPCWSRPRVQQGLGLSLCRKCDLSQMQLEHLRSSHCTPSNLQQLLSLLCMFSDLSGDTSYSWEWWTHLWLNEGFASWIEYLCVDHCFPEYDIWTQFVSADYTRAQELDALDNSHPIEVSVGHPSEVDEIFDAISYSKGASVIRMLHDYIGDEDFRKGMNLYLTKFQQRNAATEDLWESLEKASGKPIAAVMNTWTKQMGFPLIYVEAEQQEDDKVLKLVQKKFCASGPYTGEDFPTWMVPISICTSEDPTCAKMQILMDKPELTVVLKDTKPEQWVKVGTQNFIFLLPLLFPFALGILVFLWKNLLFFPVLLWGFGSHSSPFFLVFLQFPHKLLHFQDCDGFISASSQVYVTVLKHGDSSTLDTMLKLHKQADMQEEKNRIERVLGAISQPELIQKVLTFALSEEVRPQDTVSVIGGVAGGSKQGRKAAWKFVRDNWEELYNRYQGGFLISRLIKLTVDGFANDKMAAEVKVRTFLICCLHVFLGVAGEELVSK